MKVLELMDELDLDPEGIVHVGANNGNEARAYSESDATTCIYIEPITEVFNDLAQRVSLYLGRFAVNALCSDTNGEEVVFNIASNGAKRQVFYR